MRLVAMYATLAAAAAALPRLVVRPGSPATFATADGEPHTPRQVNYIRLNAIQHRGGPPPIHHSTFDTGGTGAWNETQSVAALRRMRRGGFNWVRVFLDSGSMADPWGLNGEPTGTQKVSEPYLDNLAVFVKAAAEQGIYTMVTLPGPLSNAYFNSIMKPLEWASPPNSFFLSQEGQDAAHELAQLVAQGLKDRIGSELATNATIFSLANEAAYTDSAKPFTMTSGCVPAPFRCCMGSPADRQECADRGAMTYLASGASGVRSVLPDALVTFGTFTNLAVGKPGGPNGVEPGKWDDRYPFRVRNLTAAATGAIPHVDFLDIHIYPKAHVPHPGEVEAVAAAPANWSVAAELRSIEWDDVDISRTPVILGETGSFFNFFSSPDVAVPSVINLQLSLCPRGFRGFGYWTFDTWEQGGFLWTLVDSGDGSHKASPGSNPPFPGAIEKALAPVFRPDPCKA